MANLDTIKDQFAAPALDATVWTQFTAGGATMSYASNGATMTFPATTSATTDGDISSGSGSLVGSSVAINVKVVQSSAATTSTFIFRMQNTSSNVVGFKINSGNLIMYKTVAGTGSDIVSITHSLVTHAWLRIKESGGTTFWQTSPSGMEGTWRNQWSETNPITETSLLILLAGISTGIDTNPGVITWANLNMTPNAAINNASIFSPLNPRFKFDRRLAPPIPVSGAPAATASAIGSSALTMMGIG